MRVSTVVIGLGIVLLAVPLPGTFVGGALVILAGVISRLVGW